MAKTMSMVFKDSFTKEDYDELYQCLQNERILLSQVLLKIRKTTKKCLMGWISELS
jgi:hypothetical protein